MVVELYNVKASLRSKDEGALDAYVADENSAKEARKNHETESQSVRGVDELW